MNFQNPPAAPYLFGGFLFLAMNTIPYDCNYVPDLFNMAKYNEVLHVYYDNLNTKDLQACHRLITKILKSRGHGAEDIKISKPKGIKLKSGKNHKPIMSYFNDLILNNYLPVTECGVFETIMTEDWSALFSENLNEKREYYVYCHSNVLMPNHLVSTKNGNFKFYGIPFYIGKGTGDRINNLSSRSNAHKRKVSEILAHSGVSKDHVMYKVADGLTEREAFIIESKLISYFGTLSEVNKYSLHFTGRKGGVLINSEIPSRPKWISESINTNKIKP